MTAPLLGEPSVESGFAPPLEVVVETIAARSRFMKTWTHLTDLSKSSIFMSPLWVETWLDIFGDMVSPSLVTFRSGESEVGACLVGETPLSWRRPFRRLALNATGEPEEHDLYMEYNTLLSRPEWVDIVARGLAAHMNVRLWDEFVLHGFSTGAALDILKQEFSGLELEERRQASYFVDLAALRLSGLSYVGSLGSGRRQYIRRKLRYQAESGEPTLESASSTGGALAMLDELAGLNSRRFQSLGRRGMWQSDRFTAFHRAFVEKGFEQGKVQLLRVTAGGKVIGVVYNLVHENRVYFYQCGYNYTADKRLSPGTVTLTMAIEHAAALGFDEFDFLAGDASYKEWMSTGRRQLVWAVFRRPSPRVWAYSRLRALKNRIIQ